MRFGLKAIFYATAVVAAGMAAFSACGILPAAMVIVFWGLVFSTDRPQLTLHAGAIVGFLLVLCTGLLLSGPRVHEAAVNNQCSNELRQIALAVNNYENAYGCFPPAYVADDNGRPMHSWRVLISPFLCERSLYNKYDFSEPWDSPNNRRLIPAMPACFQCPVNHNDRSKGVTSYVAVTGPNTMWPGANNRRMQEVADGPEWTLLVTEAPGTGIHWTEPRDFSVNEFLEAHASDNIASQNHPHTNDAFISFQVHSYAVFADNHTARLWESIPQELLAALVTVDGGEKVDFEGELQKLGESSRHYRWARIVAMTVFLMLALLPARQVPQHLARPKRSASEEAAAELRP